MEDHFIFILGLSYEGPPINSGNCLPFHETYPVTWKNLIYKTNMKSLFGICFIKFGQQLIRPWFEKYESSSVLGCSLLLKQPLDTEYKNLKWLWGADWKFRHKGNYSASLGLPSDAE